MKGPRNGFTLVELLVVIAIIGVLIALLLPAVQAAREAARRAQCANNLKQMALGIHNHHDVNGAFPPGNYHRNSTNNAWKRGSIGWPAYILPYMEEENLYDRINFDVDAWTSSEADPYFNRFGAHGNSANQFAAQNMPNAFVCPSAERVGSELEFKDYAMNGGNQLSSCCPERAINSNGVGYKNSEVRFADITDGTSNTFLFLEQDHSSEASDMVGKPANPFFWVTHSSEGLALSHQGGTSFPPNHRQTRLSCRTARSDHPTGIQVAYCDGSVGFVAETIAQNPWRALFTRNGGEVFDRP